MFIAITAITNISLNSTRYFLITYHKYLTYHKTSISDLRPSLFMQNISEGELNTLQLELFFGKVSISLDWLKFYILLNSLFHLKTKRSSHPSYLTNISVWRRDSFIFFPGTYLWKWTWQVRPEIELGSPICLCDRGGDSTLCAHSDRRL